MESTIKYVTLLFCEVREEYGKEFFVCEIDIGSGVPVYQHRMYYIYI